MLNCGSGKTNGDHLLDGFPRQILCQLSGGFGSSLARTLARVGDPVLGIVEIAAACGLHASGPTPLAKLPINKALHPIIVALRKEDFAIF